MAAGFFHGAAASPGAARTAEGRCSQARMPSALALPDGKMPAQHHKERDSPWLVVSPARPTTNCGRNAAPAFSTRGGLAMGLGTILIIILVIALLGGFSGLGGGPFYGTGYYGGGGLGLVLIIVIILVVLGRI
jgi:hypothetical protein